MKFRVVEFKRKGRRLEFNRFIYNGFKMGQNGNLYIKNKKVNTTDRRRRFFYLKDFETGRYDEEGMPVYENDICQIIGDIMGQIRYIKDKGAFLLVVRNGHIKVPYSFLDSNEVKLKLKGHIYEKNRG